MGRIYEAMVKYKGSSEDGSSRRDELPVVNAKDLVESHGVFASDRRFLNAKSKKEFSDLAERLAIFADNKGSRILQFTSSRNGEGTSSIVMNVARYINDLVSHTEERVLVVDAHLQRPTLNHAFDVSLSPGLAEILDKKGKVYWGIKRVGESNTYVLPSGGNRSYDLSTFGKTILFSFFSEVRKYFRYVLIDSPPLLSSSGALNLAMCADAIFLVIQAHGTHWEVAKKAKAHLEDYNRKIDAIVLNRVQDPIPDWVYKRL